MDRLIDPHCHLDDPRLETTLGESLQTAWEAGVHGALIPGYGPQRWPRQSELLQQGGRFELWGGFGLHPWAIDPDRGLERQTAELERGWHRFALRWGDRLRAVGEFGLDRSRRMAGVPLALQRGIFEWHLRKAAGAGLPLILHLVRADGPALSLLAQGGPWQGVVHAFSGHRETVARYLALGLSLSFGSGLLVGEKARGALRVTPLDRLMFETDGPAGWRGAPVGELCGPARLIEIVQAASQVLGKSVEYLLARHRENCQRVFRLDPA